MDWAILIFEILLAVAVFLIGLFVKNYLPYKGVLNSDSWHPELVDEIAKFLKK